MYLQNILLGRCVWVDPTASVNNVDLGDEVVIGKKCTVFGSENHLLQIGRNTKIGIMTILNGYSAPLSIGSYCSIGPHCHFLVDSGPTASPRLLKKYPISASAIHIGDHCHIGASCMIIAGSRIGEGAVIEPNSFVNGEVEAYSVYGGSPARLIRKIHSSD